MPHKKWEPKVNEKTVNLEQRTNFSAFAEQPKEVMTLA